MRVRESFLFYGFLTPYLHLLSLTRPCLRVKGPSLGELKVESSSTEHSRYITKPVARTMSCSTILIHLLPIMLPCPLRMMLSSHPFPLCPQKEGKKINRTHSRISFLVRPSRSCLSDNFMPNLSNSFPVAGWLTELLVSALLSPNSTSDEPIIPAPR